MTDNRPLPIVYVFQYPDTPTHRQTITAELIDWAHAHATEHTQEPTA